MTKIPYKDPEKQKRAMRKVMVRHRIKNKQQKKQAQSELLKEYTPTELRKKFPSVSKLVFGRELERIAMEMDFGKQKKPKKKGKKRRKRSMERLRQN